MDTLEDFYAYIGDPDVNQKMARKALADEMAWVVTHEGATPSQIAATLGMPQREVDRMIRVGRSERQL